MIRKTPLPITLIFIACLQGLANLQPAFAEQTTFYFHNYRELSIYLGQFQLGGLQVPPISADPSNPSARAFADSTADLPSGGGTSQTLSSQIYVTGSQSGYAAVVAWLTKPFSSGVILDGEVVMRVWMSSSDGVWPWEGSEYFMGIADYSPVSSNPLTVLWAYTSPPSAGNVFTSSPAEYSASMHISQHNFEPGSMLMFFAGAASKKQGWEFTVYFDSPAWNSRADIPADPSLTIPEFGDLAILLAVTIAFVQLSLIASGGHGTQSRFKAMFGLPLRRRNLSYWKLSDRPKQP